MKRIISTILILTMALVLFSCTSEGNGGKTYTGIYEYKEAKLVINGNTATLSTEFSNEDFFEGGKKVTVNNISSMTGIITSNENGVIEISFNAKGAAATAQMKLSGSAAEEYKEMVLADIDQLEDGPLKSAQLKLINGEVVKMAYGDELWEAVGFSDYVITLVLDEEKGTFTEAEDEKAPDSTEGSETLDIPDNTEASTEHVTEDDIPDNTEDSTEYVTEDNSPSDTDWLKGDWTTVVRVDDREYGVATAFVTEITYGFGKDGTGAINDRAWISPGAEWKVAGKGYVETYFIYTLEGDTLTITHTGSEFGEYPEEEIETNVYTVIRNQDGSITWVPAEGGEGIIFRQVEHDLTVEELLLLFGLNPNVPEN